MKEAKSEHRSGLILSGAIEERTRRHIELNNTKTEIVTYVIVDDNNRHYYVDEFAPSVYYEVGDTVEIPVYVKPYKKRNGNPSYSLCLLKEYHPITGESF